MHNTYNHNTTPFTLASDDWSPSALSEVADQLVEVDYYVWRLVTEYQCPIAMAQVQRLGVSVDTHEVIGEYYQDLTHWCDIEQKIEYCEDSRVLLAPSISMQRFKVDFTWEQAAADLGYSDWAA